MSGSLLFSSQKASPRSEKEQLVSLPGSSVARRSTMVSRCCRLLQPTVSICKRENCEGIRGRCLQSGEHITNCTDEKEHPNKHTEKRDTVSRAEDQRE